MTKNKLIKIFGIFIAVILAAIFIMSEAESIIDNIKHPHDLNGYYYNIDDLRQSIDKFNQRFDMPIYYENNDYLFSKDFGDIIVDFVIRENQIAVVRINCKSSGDKIKYGELSSSYGTLDSDIKRADTGTQIWYKVIPGLASPAGSTKVQWCIVSEGYEEYDSFEFEYNGKTYYIIYEIIPE